MVCKDFEEIVGAYVLDALTTEERRVADEHLAGCSECTHVMQDLRSVADLLPLSVPQVEPSPLLKERIFSAIQSPAYVASKPAQDVPVSFAQRRGSGRAASRRWAGRHWAPSLIAAAAVLMFVLLGGMLTWNISLQQQVHGLAMNNSLLQRQVQTLSYQMQGTATAPLATGQVTYYAKQDITLLVIHGLPHLQGQQVYQGWLIQGKQPTSVGLLNVQNGDAIVGFAGNVTGFDLAAVSLEPGPVASSHAPQGQVLAVGPLLHPISR